MKKHQVWGFNFISKGTDERINVLTGTCDESEDEVQITCFDGVAFFEVNRNNRTYHYCIEYPKMNKLTNYEKEIIEDYCGYEPTAGEYGVVCGALGLCFKINKKTYEDNLKNINVR